MLPYIGAILSIAPAGIAALGHSPTAGIIVIGAMLAYQEFESRVLVPKIYGHALRLPSSVVFFALMAGGTLMGLLGALLALPVAATIMMLIEELRVDLPGEQEQVGDAILRAPGMTSRKRSTNAARRVSAWNRRRPSRWRSRWTGGMRCWGE